MSGNEIVNGTTSSQLLTPQRDERRAKLFIDQTQRPFRVQSMTINLGTARLETDPFPIKIPFRTLYVADATDLTSIVYLKPSSQDSYQSSFKLSSNDSWDSDQETAECYLFWAAQPGKTLTIVFFVDSFFRSGKQITQNAGGVSVSEGTVVDAIASVNLSATTAAIIAPQDLTRIVSNIQNKTGADLFIGGTNAVNDSGATAGIIVPNGGIWVHKNTGALYGYSVLGGRVNRMDER